MPNEADKSEEQKAAEATVQSFRKALGPFVVAAETTRMAMVFTDATVSGNPVIFANDSFLSLTGYDRGEVLGQRLSLLMARGADLEALAAIEAAFEHSSDSGPEFAIAAKMTASSGPPSSSARLGMKVVMLFSISRRLSTLPRIGRRRIVFVFSWTS
jgi:PAS domain